MDITTATAPEVLTSEINFLIIFLVFDTYSKTKKLDGMYIITAEEVMDKLDMFQPRFVKIDKFGWWDFEIISVYAGMQFTSTEFQDEC